MARPFRQQIDEGILDQAAALFARRGFAKTSVQDVADAVGLSKAGLLHHYASKETLYRAVLAQAGVLGQRVLTAVGELPPGPERDRRALEVLVDVALAHPGVVALLLAPITQGEQDCAASEVEAAGAAALQAFGVDPGAPTSERAIRVLGALTALAVLSLTAHQEDDVTRWRPWIVATCFDALGHRLPGAALPIPHQVEA
ncbi:TetR/AcrR family transcriptional regulator [Blastococcus sp. SYSU DS0669]